MEIPKPVLWPKTPTCSSRKRARKPWRPRRLWDGAWPWGKTHGQLGAWPGLLCGRDGRVGSQTPLPSAGRCSCAGREAFSLLRSQARSSRSGCKSAALPRFKFYLARADQK